MIERFDLFGKLGITHWEYDETTQIGSLPPSTLAVSSSDFGWGLGMSFNVGKKWAIPIAYEQFCGDIDKAGVFSISAIYHF